MSPINQKQIARNTILLYIRMGVLMVIGLYTSRVTLDALGAIDNGIYGTVAGIVGMFAFMSNTMASACQRFFAFELGHDDKEALKRTFSLCVTVFAAIAILVALLSETVGMWLLYRKIDSDGRFNAAMTVFQCAIVSFLFTIMSTPYQGMIIIREKMKVYTYISVFEVLGNLAVALGIAHFGGDRLILFGFLMLAVNAGKSVYFILYCHICYPECRYKYCWDRKHFMEIFSFAGWNMIGSLSGTFKTQGLTILINVFFGNAMVSARMMAQKVFNTVQQFADNFVLALKPQMIKSYSAGDTDGMFKLLFQGSKFSFYLLFLVSLPMILETGPIVDVWLKDVPEHTVIFTRLVLINALIEVVVAPLSTAMQAYGKMRNYLLLVGGFILLILPVAYVFLKLGFPPETVFYVSIVICTIAVWLRVILIHHYIGLSLSDYLSKVVVPILLVVLISVPGPLILEIFMEKSLLKFLTVCSVAVVMTAGSAFFAGMTKTERRHTLDTIFGFLHDKFNINIGICHK